MRIRTAVVLAALGFCLALIAPPAAAADTALGESKWSLEVGTDLGIDYADYTVGIRRHSGAGSAWRVGVEASFDNSDGDGKRTETGSADLPMARFEDYHDWVATLHWMRFAAVRDNLAATFGVGAFYEDYRSSSRSTTAPGTPSFYERENLYASSTYGLDLTLGAEWFFSRRLSLGGQAGLRAGLGSLTQTSIYRDMVGANVYEDRTEVESDLTTLRTSGGRILLSVYF